MHAMLSGFRASLYPGNPEALALLISGNHESKALENEWRFQKASLIILEPHSWNHDLSPFPAPACFRGGESFTGGADDFLSAVLTEILPEAEARMNLRVQTRAILGYSLAGLFALYACTKTHVFQKAASVSGSLWYDGFPEFFMLHPPKAGRIYLSLGELEEKTKNARLARVGEGTRKAIEIFASTGIEATLEMNPGNHFSEPDQRILRAMNALFPE